MKFSKQILGSFLLAHLFFNKEWIINKSTVFQNYNRQNCHFQRNDKSRIIKGQINSEGIYEVIDFPNYQRKYCKNFCPKSLFEV